MEMKHTKEEVLNALAFIQTFSDDEEYKKQLLILYNYINDLVTLMQEYQKTNQKYAEIILKREVKSD